jgi:plasmid maintenance system antidote protein VapI
MEIHNPPHPGEIIGKECLKPLGLSVTAIRRRLACRVGGECAQSER